MAVQCGQASRFKGWLCCQGWLGSRKIGFVLMSAVVSIFLAGCATPPESSFVSQFERSGRFHAQVMAPGQSPESVQGAFRWRQRDASWQLDLLGPLGNTLARLDASPGVVTLQQPGQPERQATSASALVSDLFGAQIPVDALVDWMRGRILDDALVRDVTRDSQGRVESLRQGSWQVRFSQYDGAGPRLMEISGLDLGRAVNLRMVVDSVVEYPTAKERLALVN